ncbi:MAG: zeta toxin family protein, partial [Lysobacter sp.]
MSGEGDRLSKESHSHILREKVIPGAQLDEYFSHENPRAIILAGQPGAGKGALKHLAEQDFSDDIVAVDPDRLRDYHPMAKKWQELSPYGWSQQTNADAGQWARELREEVIAQRKNLIVDTTLGSAAPAIQTIRDLRVSGYEVEVRVMATHRLESELGMDERFTRGIDFLGIGRDVPLPFHNQVYNDLPGNLDAVRDATGVPVRIFDRSGAELYDSRWVATPPSEVLREARDLRLRDPEVTQQLREGWQRQADWHRTLPETIQHNQNVSPETAKVLQHDVLERDRPGVGAQRAEVATTLDEVIRPGAARAPAVSIEPMSPGMRRAATLVGVSALGAVASAYDAKETSERVGTLLAQDNPLAAQSALAHYAARGTGGWIGGATAGLVAGSVTGPGAVAFVIGGAVAGSYVGEHAAKLWESRQISHQTDRQDVDWEFNGRQWVRYEQADLHDDGVDAPARQAFSALPDKARELTYLASNSATQLALGKLEPPRDPYVQAANASDRPSLSPVDWKRNEDSGQWQREAVIARTDRGHPLTQTDRASPERSVELDRAAEQTIRENISAGPAPVAARYQLAYRANGWEQAGPMPAAVATALHNPDLLLASDSKLYQRAQDGVWRQEGNGEDASNNVQRELEGTRAQLQPTLAQHEEMLAGISVAQAPATREQLDRTNLLAAYAAVGVAPNPDRVDAALEAVQR